MNFRKANGKYWANEGDYSAVVSSYGVCGDGPRFTYKIFKDGQTGLLKCGYCDDLGTALELAGAALIEFVDGVA